MIKYFGWKSIFLINFPLGVISIIIIQFFAPVSTTTSNKINYFNQAIIIGGLALLTFTLTEAGHLGWSNPLCIITMILGLFLLLLHKRLDQYSAHPVIAHEVRSNNLIISSVIIGFLCNLIFYGSVFIFSIFFQNQLHLSALETGMAFMPMMILTAFVNFYSKYFSSWYSIRTLSLVGSIVSFFGFLILLFVSEHWTIYQLFIPMILLGSGTSFAMPVMTNLVLSQATENTAGSASALFNCARQMGGVTGVALFGLILNLYNNYTMITGLRMIAFAALAITLIWIMTGARKLPNVKLHNLN